MDTRRPGKARWRRPGKALWWLLAAPLALAPGPSAADDPQTPITLIVASGAGGGTDVTARALAGRLRDQVGVPVTVIGRPDEGGRAGYRAIAEAAPDGYTLGVITAGTVDAAVGGSALTPLWLYNLDPAILYVRTDAPYRDVRDLLGAIEAQPGSVRASGGQAGGIWHRGLTDVLQAAGLSADAATWGPSRGALPALERLVAGEVDLVVCSGAEAEAYLDNGQVRRLAILAATRDPAAPDVPTLEEATGLNRSVYAWRAVVGPPGLPEDVIERLTAAFKEAQGSPELQDFMARRGYRLVWREPADLANLLAP